jgi:hypothetical protein
MQIGKHQWRLLVANGARGLCTSYEFMDESAGFWCSQQSWPGYDINDPYLGLPRGLGKLHEREKPTLIKYGLAIASAPSRQMRLGF